MSIDTSFLPDDDRWQGNSEAENLEAAFAPVFHVEILDALEPFLKESASALVVVVSPTRTSILRLPHPTTCSHNILLPSSFHPQSGSWRGGKKSRAVALIPARARAAPTQGCGSGHLIAAFAHLVGPRGTVCGLEVCGDARRAPRAARGDERSLATRRGHTPR